MVTTKILGIGGCGTNIAKEIKNLDVYCFDKDEIKVTLDADVNFICAGIGGDTTTKHLSKIKTNKKLLNTAFVVMPFEIEKQRRKEAEILLKKIKTKFTSTIIFDNEVYAKKYPKIAISKLFQKINEDIRESILCIIESCTVPSLVSLDLQDLKAILTKNYFGCVKIIENENDFLSANYNINKSKGAIIIITASSDIKLDEINKIGEDVCSNLTDYANVIWATKVIDHKNKLYKALKIKMKKYRKIFCFYLG